MFGRAKKSKAKPASALGHVITTLEKQAASPTGFATLRYLAPRLLPVIAPIILGMSSFLGIVPGCQTGRTTDGKLPEITQKIRPGAQAQVVANDPNRPNQYQLTSGQKPQPPAGQTPLPGGQQPAAPQQPYAPLPAGSGREIIFAFWNCENFFDDRDDHRGGAGDKEYDPWFAKNPNILQLKLDKMTEAILSINNGKGPDIFAMCEVESVRAAQLLQAALNAKLSDPGLHYTNLVMKEMSSGRHIAPAVLTRLPVNTSRTRVLGNRERIIQCHVMMGDKELIVIASHWTSRLQDGSRQRMEYAQTIYGAINAIYIANPAADVILCGDFNDNPTDVSVTQGLHATGNPSEVLQSKASLKLLDLFGNWTPKSGEGTLYYNGWNHFDHIIVSPGMLDSYGWSCDPTSARVVNSLTKPGDKNHRPWRFGGEKDSGPRGYSDHFPVTVRLIARP